MDKAAKAKKWGLAHDYGGLPGGWIYYEDREKPVCQGWVALYHRHQYKIEAWLKTKAPVKKAKLSPLTVAVVCPYCHEAIPDPEYDSYFWELAVMTPGERIIHNDCGYTFVIPKNVPQTRVDL